MEKPGWKTTEFWLSLAATLVGAVLASGAVSNDIVLQILGGLSSVLAALGYSAARTVVKGNEAKAKAAGVLAKSPFK